MAVLLKKDRFEVHRKDHQTHGKFVAVPLAPKEFDLLALLMEAKGKLLSREAINALLWPDGEHKEFQSRVLDQHVRRLRRKLKADGSRLVTHIKRGYRWVR